MDKRTLLVVLAVVGVVALAAGFRLYDIQNYPAGLFPDEAANGEDALLILDGDVRPFYPRGNGREGLFYVLEAASIELFGVGVWQLHIVSALVGIITVLAMYFATRPFFGRLAGVLAALFLATSHWHVTLSRTGFRAILIPLFVAAFTAFVGYTIQSVKQQKRGASYVHAALAGAAFMGGFYTYIAYRVMVGVIVGIAGLLILAAIHPNIGFPHFRRYGKQILVAVIAGLIVFAPLGWFFIQEPSAFVGRAGQVSVFNKELQAEYGGGTLIGTILYSTRETILSFFAGEGDLNWRHNVSGYPLLNPLGAALFLLGLAWTIGGTWMVARKIIRGTEVHLGMIYPYLLLVIVGMLAPVISTAEGMPHGLRSVGLIVPIFLLAGTAGAVSVRWLMKKMPHNAAHAATYGITIGVLVLFGLYDGTLYFFVARNTAAAHYAYRADLTEVSKYLLDYAHDHPKSPRPYLVLDTFSVQTVHFLTHTKGSQGWNPAPHDYLDHPDEAQHKYITLDPAMSHQTPLTIGERIIFTQSTFPDADRYEQTYGNTIELIAAPKNRFGEEIMRIYKHSGEVEGIQDEKEHFDLDA